MGPASSKARSVRKLPTSSTLPHSSPSVARNAPPPPPPPSSSGTSNFEQQDTLSNFDYGSNQKQSSTSTGRMGRVEASNQARGGMGKVQFSGEKDDAIKQDAMDPQFMKNLGVLGQVRIHDAGEFVPAQAQRTLLSRTPSLTSPLSTPPQHLHVQSLISLLDQLKTLPPNSDPSSVYQEYGMNQVQMEELRKWVNSVSVGEDEVRVEDGEEVREMRAIWVGGRK